MTKKLLTSDKIYIGKSEIPGAGRGVFAGRDIKKGEIVEKSPIIEVTKYDESNLNRGALVTYFFYFGENKERLGLALGFGSIYNHGDKPNIVFKIKPKEKVIDFVAIGDIKKGEEITFDYRGSGNTRKPLWFEV